MKEIYEMKGAGRSIRGQRRRVLRLFALLQGLYQDALHPAHVDEIDFQGPAAGGVQPFRGVALPQSYELVALPDLGPRQRTVEQSLGEFGHRRSVLRSTALDPVRSPQGVGGQLRRVVGRVRGAAAARLAEVGLDQLAPVVDADQLAAQADLHLLPRRAQG